MKLKFKKDILFLLVFYYWFYAKVRQNEMEIKTNWMMAANSGVKGVFKEVAGLPIFFPVGSLLSQIFYKEQD